nr:transposase [Nuttalliella namaqua]
MTLGIISQVTDILKDTVKEWSKQDWACIIIFDKMALRLNLQYDKHLAFTMAKTTLHMPKIKNVLLALVMQLHKIQLFVKAVVCDQGSSDVALLEQLKVTPGNPFSDVGGHKAHSLFNTAHLIKCTRITFCAPHKLFIGDGIVHWTFICELYKCSNLLRLKLARKWTDDHIYSKPFNSIKVKFATQVLRESVSVAMSVVIALGEQPMTAKCTAEFIDGMDKLFEFLNSKMADHTIGNLSCALTAK